MTVHCARRHQVSCPQGRLFSVLIFLVRIHATPKWSRVLSDIRGTFPPHVCVVVLTTSQSKDEYTSGIRHFVSIPTGGVPPTSSVVYVDVSVNEPLVHTITVEFQFFFFLFRL